MIGAKPQFIGFHTDVVFHVRRAHDEVYRVPFQLNAHYAKRASAFRFPNRVHNRYGVDMFFHVSLRVTFVL
jgi:hypothetical protein